MKQLWFLFLWWIILISLPTFGQDRASGTYQNPVIPGDFPDPTVIRVGKMYYAAGTSSDFAPIYPLYESVDLVNWKQIGSAFSEMPAWASKNFWAPELYFKDGTFFIYYTAKRKSDGISCIGVATTKDLRKGFIDHGIIVEWGNEAIDGFVFQDDNQKMYICWKAYGLTKGRPIEILASEMIADGLSLVGDHFSLTRYDEGWKGEGDEGPCLVKHGEYYYLFYSVGGCCDNRCSYRIRVSRSKNLKTGWEQNPETILESGNTWKCPGHGTLVSTPDNRFFYIYHSYNSTDFEYIGRQGMLDEMVWNETTGWPRFKNGNTPSVHTDMPFSQTIQRRDSVFADNFSTDKNLKFWQWDLTKPKPGISIKNGLLTLSAEQEGITFTGISPKTGNYSFEAELSGETTDLCGICVYGNSENLLALAVSGSKLVLFQLKKGIKEFLVETVIPENLPVSLKLMATHGRIYQFFLSNDQKNWIPVKIQNDYTVDGNFLPQWGVAMRTGLLIDGKPGAFSSVQMKNSFNKILTEEK
jgi:beta-xylosidase